MARADARRQFDYHRVEERGAEVTVDGTAAHLVARIITDATVYGTRADWRLRLAMDYARQDQGWIALRSIATTW